MTRRDQRDAEGGDGGVDGEEDRGEAGEGAGGVDGGLDAGVDAGVVGGVLGRIESVEGREFKNTRLLVLLLGGGRSVSDLVYSIYGKRYGDAGYRKLYMRVSRRLASLEREGLVSRALFGKERPYRVTRHGRVVLSATMTVATDRVDTGEILGVWSVWHSVLIGVTALTLAGALVSPPGLLAAIALWTSLILLGSSIATVAMALREVI